MIYVIAFSQKKCIFVMYSGPPCRFGHNKTALLFGSEYKGSEMKIHIVARTNHCLPLFLSNYGLDVKSVKFADCRFFEDDYRECVIIGDGRYIKKVLRFISSCEPRSVFDWSIL